jgi:enoyl-CoA hydratase/carnithine racemase
VSDTDAHVLLEVEDGVATVTLNRPDRLNAFAGSMRDDLHDALDRAEEDAGTCG